MFAYMDNKIFYLLSFKSDLRPAMFVNLLRLFDNSHPQILFSTFVQFSFINKSGYHAQAEKCVPFLQTF